MARRVVHGQRRRHVVQLRPARRRHLLGRHPPHGGVGQGDVRRPRRRRSPQRVRRIVRRLLRVGRRRRRHRRGALQDAECGLPAGDLHRRSRHRRCGHPGRAVRRACRRQGGRGHRRVHAGVLHEGRRNGPRPARGLRVGTGIPRQRRSRPPRHGDLPGRARGECAHGRSGVRPVRRDRRRAADRRAGGRGIRSSARLTGEPGHQLRAHLQRGAARSCRTPLSARRSRRR